MLSTSKIVAFVPTTDSVRAREFYEGVLGLHFVSDDWSALVLDANGTRVRITRVPHFTPAPFTILGWEVTDIGEMASHLTERGVTFLRIEGMAQDDLGVMTFSGGDRVAWFKDPDGNTLSISQHAS